MSSAHSPNRTRPLSDAEFGAVRAAATLVHAVPGLRARISDGDRVALEVGPHPASSVRVVTPCAFHRSVTDAWHEHRRGQGVALRGLGDTVDLRVAIGTGPAARAFPGGIYRAPIGDHAVYTFATTLERGTCVEVARALTVGHHDSLPQDATLSVRHDECTNVTLLAVELTAQEAMACEPDVLDLATEALSRVTSLELIEAATSAPA